MQIGKNFFVQFVNTIFIASSQDHNGSTALHKAASIGYSKCLKVLLEAKVDIQHKVCQCS